ncbi:MAG: hypothetical protein RIF41_35725, partial [Polyangiaceae bacterium]
MSWSALLHPPRALALTAALVIAAACTSEGPTDLEVGSSGSGAGTGSGVGTGAGNVGGAGTGTPSGSGTGTGQQTQATWQEATGTQSQLKGSMDIVGTMSLYAQVGDRIEWWSGSNWMEMTDTVAGLRAAFHVIDEGLMMGQGGGGGLGGGGLGGGGLGGGMPMPMPMPIIAAVVVDEIYKWDNNAWNAITSPAGGLQAAFHYLADEDTYAVVGDRIDWWDGNVWAPHTEEMLGLDSAMHFISPDEIYALAGDEIVKWDGLSWAPQAAPIEGIRPAI